MRLEGVVGGGDMSVSFTRDEVFINRLEGDENIFT